MKCSTAIDEYSYADDAVRPHSSLNRTSTRTREQAVVLESVVRRKLAGQTLRQVLPPLSCLSTIALLIPGIAIANPWKSLTMPAIYLCGAALAGVSSSRQHGWRVALLFPIATNR